MINQISSSEKELLEEYLKNRLQNKNIKSGLSIVYDITFFCNLSCRGCAVVAKKHSDQYIESSDLELQSNQVIEILDKIKAHIVAKDIDPFFINYGGGEPFLRKDFKDIIKYSAKLFGKQSIGVDTNGTVASIEDINEIKECVSYIGISIDGLEAYHNYWRGSSKNGNSFQKSIGLIKQMVQDPELQKILEVSSVATKDNIEDIPELIEFLYNLGVKNYSVHRTYPVGRMAKMQNIIPDANDYLRLALIVALANKKYNLDCHFHHSLESIYGTLLLHVNTYIADKVVGNPDSRSSFGVDPTGKIYFDPWCMVKPWNNLTGGNILDKNFEFDLITSGKGMGMLSIAKNYSLKSIRCNACKLNCSGGSRIAASAHYLSTQKRSNLSDLMIGLSKIDPACPIMSQQL